MNYEWRYAPLVKNGSLLWNMAYMAHSDPLEDFPLKVM